MNKYLSKITVSVNGLNAPTKRQRVAEWIRKRDLHTCCLEETHFRTKELNRVKVKGWKKYSKQMDRKKMSGQQFSYQTKQTSKKRAIKGDPDGHFIILKGRIHKEHVYIVNIHAPNIGAHKYIRKILEDFKKDIDSNTLIQGDFNTHCEKWIDLLNKTSTRILQH